MAARRAQSLYCAIGPAKRRNKAIAPYALCLEGTTYVTIGKEYYMVTADAGQQPPDPKYFSQAKK